MVNQNEIGIITSFMAKSLNSNGKIEIVKVNEFEDNKPCSLVYRQLVNG